MYVYVDIVANLHDRRRPSLSKKGDERRSVRMGNTFESFELSCQPLEEKATHHD